MHERWIEALAGGPLPVEGRATCMSCAMLPRGGPFDYDDPEDPFDAATKCCSYAPFLPSFLAGGVLAGAGAARAVLEARIEERTGVTPIGVAALPDAGERYARMIADDPTAFGRRATVVCPFYGASDGRCGIWRHRNGVCATYFCRHERGLTGRRFWTVLRQLLSWLERGLALHCAASLGLDAGALELLYFEGLRPPHDSPAVDLVVWGSYLGRERDFFLACAERVAAMSQGDVVAAGGEPVANLLAAVRACRAELDDEQVPPRLALAEPLYRIGRRPAHVRASARAAPEDFVEVPEALIAALPRLVGRPVDEALAELQAEGLAVDELALRRLLDFGVLTPG